VIDGEVAFEELEPEEVEPEEVEPEEVEEDVVGVVVAPVPLPELPVAVVALEPECSFATTTPMTAVRPAAASTEARVSVRTRDQAFRRSYGVDCVSGRDMAVGDLRSGDAPTRPRAPRHPRKVPCASAVTLCCIPMGHGRRAPLRSPAPKRPASGKGG